MIIKLKKPVIQGANNCTLIIDKCTILFPSKTGDEHSGVLATAINAEKAGLLKQTKIRVRQYTRKFFIPQFEEYGKVLFFTRPKFPSQAPFGVEFNPNRLGKEKTNELLGFIYQHFFFGDWKEFAEQATLSRADVSIDILGLDIRKAFFSAPGAKTSQSYHGIGNRKQSEIYNFPGNKRLTIYDKAAERRERAKKDKSIVVADIPEAWTRAETNLRKCGKLRNLKSLKNPLLDFSIAQRTKPEGVDQDFWKMLCLAADNTCFEHVLGMINSSALRNKIKKHQAAHPVNGWDANKLWEQWPGAVKNSGLIDFLANLE